MAAIRICKMQEHKRGPEFSYVDRFLKIMQHLLRYFTGKSKVMWLVCEIIWYNNGVYRIIVT
jgi:hypothetical protein